MDMKHTLNCIVCLTEPAVTWTGYVREPRHEDGPQDYFAGFCETHYGKCESLPHDAAVGGDEKHCFGLYKPEMGDRPLTRWNSVDPGPSL